MSYLLDTHYVLWTLFEPEKVKGTARQILEDNEIPKFISGVNLWEISLKYALGKLDLENTNPADLVDTLIGDGFGLADLDNHLLATYYQLSPKKDHRDPFDRLLVWQAISNGYTLITHDARIEQYKDDGLKLVLG